MKTFVYILLSSQRSKACVLYTNIVHATEFVVVFYTFSHRMMCALACIHVGSANIIGRDRRCNVLNVNAASETAVRMGARTSDAQCVELVLYGGWCLCYAVLPFVYSQILRELVLFVFLLSSNLYSKKGKKLVGVWFRQAQAKWQLIIKKGNHFKFNSVKLNGKFWIAIYCHFLLLKLANSSVDTTIFIEFTK